MKITVAHISLNAAGGGELVCMSLIKTMRDAGHEVTLATVDRTDWTKLRKIFGQLSYPNQECCLFSRLPKTSWHMLQGFLLLTCYFLELFVLKFTKRNELLVSTCGEKINSIADIAYANGTPLRCASFLSDVSIERRSLSKLYDLLSLIHI